MQRFKLVFMLFSTPCIVAMAGNDVEGVKSVKDDLRVVAVLHLRILLYGGVGGMAIHVGARGRDVMGMVDVPLGSSVGVTEEEVDSV